MNSKSQVEIQTQRFFKMVEAGDLALFDNFTEAFAIFGFTKTGKTTTCHYLCNSPLQAFSASASKDSELQYKLVNPKDNSPIIGYSLHSQTQIPNIFQAKYQDRKGAMKTITLLDQPGYGDTYGFHRIFSNGYFHYRTFSKTPKLKFILAVKKSELSDTGGQFINTIQLFVGSFARYKQIKKDILNATVLLITKANPKEDKEQVKRLVIQLKELTNNMAADEKQNYLQFIDHMIKQNKLFIIEKPQNKDSQTKQTTLLRDMNQCTVFWERKIENNIVDMSQINFSVANDIIRQLSLSKNNKFKKDFQYFMGQMSKRINTFLYQHQWSFRKIIKSVMTEAESNNESHSFLQAMNKFNLIYYKFEEGPKWREKREKTEANLFKQSDPDMRSTYFIRKFKFLQHFKRQAEEFYKLFEFKNYFSRSVEQLQQFSQIFRFISKKLNLLRQQQSDSPKIIYKYSYLIQRLIEQCKIISLILYSDPQVADHFNQMKMIVDYLRPIFDQVFKQESQEHINKLKLKSIQNVNVNSLEPSQEIINFMEELLQFNQKYINKIAQVTIKYAKNKENTRQQKKYIIKKTLQYRNIYYSYYLKTPQKYQQCIENIFKLTNILGSMLLGFQQFELAREVFKSINNASSVLNIYEEELKTMTDRGKIKELFKSYGKYAEEYKRPELAIRCYQQVYERWDNYGQLQEASNKIVSLGSVNTTTTIGTNYLERLINKLYCHQIPDQIRTKINQVQGNSGIKKK